MSKAEELAEKAYPKIGLYDNLMKRKGFIEGYHQAERDLELTWEEISTLRQIFFDYNRQIRNGMSIPNDEDYCKEILKRFKAMKEK